MLGTHTVGRTLFLGAPGLLCLVVLAACDGARGGGDAGPEPQEDAEVGDAGGGPSCAFPAPVVAGTAETDALADAPAQCGQAEHAWLRSERLGEVVSLGDSERFGRALLQGLSEGAGVDLPRPPAEDVQVRRYRYLTQDRGELVESTALLAFPEGRPPGEEADVLLFPHGTTGFSAGCGPTSDTGSQLLAAVLASYGYVVVAPDFLGLEYGEPTYGELHPYLVGQATAIASLDALRAAARLMPSERGGLCLPPRFVSFGGSQGGHAALWLDRLAPYYARELEHLGAVATVPPADLLGQVERALTEVVDATANTAAFYGTASFWYGHGERLDEVFAPPLDEDLPAALRSECVPGSFDDLTTLSEIYAAPLLDAVAAGALADYAPWGCMLVENGLTTTSVPRFDDDADAYGILVVTGETDPLVHTPIERESFRTMCEGGMPVRYLECEGAGHGEGTAWALPEILRFLEARFAREPFTRPRSCEPPAPTRCEGTPAG